MNHTEHLQLSQWEKTDRIMMDDFNSDNAKLDAAVGEVQARAGMKFIKEATLQEAGNFLEISLADIPWQEYSVVCIDLMPYAGISALPKVMLYNKDMGYFTPRRENEGGEWKSAQLWLFPLFEPERREFIVTFGMSTEFFGPVSSAYRELNRVRVEDAKNLNQLLPGSRITILGLR